MSGGSGRAAGPAVILGRADGIWARSLAAAWQRRGVPTVIVSSAVEGEVGDELPVQVVRWTQRPWLARLRRLLSPALLPVQARLVARGRSRFAERAGVAEPAPWEYDFLEPFWNGFLLSRAALRLKPRFVLGQEVHSHGLATARCRGVPRFLFPWGSDVHTAVETSPAMFHLVRHALRSADLVLPTATSAVPYLVSRFGLRPERVRPISWGVDVSSFRPAGAEEKRALRRRHAIPEGGKVVVNARRFLPQWQSETILPAFLACARLCPEAHFVVIGGCYAEGVLAHARSQVAAAGFSGRFHWSEDLRLETYRDLLRACDVGVSMNPIFDMRSTTVLQLAACGLVPVLSEREEYRLMSRDGFEALFVPPHDAAALAAALERALSAAPGAELVARNRRYIEAHEDGERQMDALLELLQQATPAPAPGGAGALGS